MVEPGDTAPFTIRRLPHGLLAGHSPTCPSRRACSGSGKEGVVELKSGGQLVLATSAADGRGNDKTIARLLRWLIELTPRSVGPAQTGPGRSDQSLRPALEPTFTLPTQGRH